MTTPTLGSLHGIKVIELGRFVAAPWCGQLLADLGADVIKLEHRGEGDPIRQYGPPFLKDAAGAQTAESMHFLACNRGKRSLTIDFTRPEGAKIVRDLATKADVFIENFKAGGLTKYELDEASLRALKSDLIYLSISGFGQSGPYAHRPALDSVFQAMGGLMSVTGEAGAPPTKIGVTIVDLITGIYGALGIVAALRAREIGGSGGQTIDLALLDTAIAVMSHRAQDYLVTGNVPVANGTISIGTAPAQIFKAADGWINIQAGDDAAFITFCGYLGLPQLVADPRFRRRRDRWENLAALLEIIEPEIARRDVATMYNDLAEAGLVCSPIYSLDQTFADPHVVQRGVRREVMHSAGVPLPFVANPLRLSETPINYETPPPTVGQHSAEILREMLGLGAEEIADLVRNGAI